MASREGHCGEADAEKVHLLRYARLSSLRRTSRYAAFLKARNPCIWSFLHIRMI
jgi:hypothetical protein